MLLATARFVITTIQRKFLYFFVFFFPKVPRSIGRSFGQGAGGYCQLLAQKMTTHVQNVMHFKQNALIVALVRQYAILFCLEATVYITKQVVYGTVNNVQVGKLLRWAEGKKWESWGGGGEGNTKNTENCRMCSWIYLDIFFKSQVDLFLSFFLFMLYMNTSIKYAR